ncbi:MAG: hypothetical protein K2G03_00520 [Bacilli bacterium]|nr:hypothetical protein [Bacilli bacterium]
MKSKVKKGILAGVLATVLLTSPLIIKAGYNGTDSSSSANTSSGGGSFVPINDLDIGSQALNFSLYFLPMPSDVLGNTPEQIAARNEYWTTGFKNAIPVGANGQKGREVIVSRDNFKKAGSGILDIFEGDIASTLGGGVDYIKKPISRSKIVESVSCSEIGLTSEDFPVYLHSLNGKSVPKGKRSMEYFMDLNPDYVEGKTPIAFVNENMKNLLRFIAGVDTETGLANLSFAEDPEELTVGGITYRKNSNSLFNRGVFQGMTGEFKLFLEPGVVCNSVFYTARELATEAYIDTQSGKKLNQTVLYSIKPTFGNALGNFFILEDEPFGLRGETSNGVPSMTTREMMDAFRFKK